MKPLGQIKSLDVNFPDLNMKNEMELNKGLTVLVGANGTGKTLRNILSWVSATYVSSVLTNPESISINTLEELLKYSFNNFDLSGDFTTTFTSGLILKCYLEKGKVINIDFLNSKDIEGNTLALYMSAEMRIYDNIIKYFKIRKSLDFSKDSIEKMYTVFGYKIYDVIMCEKLFNILTTQHFDISDIDFEKFQMKEKYKTIFMENEDTIYLTFEDESGNEQKKDILSFGAGHQSIINMLVTPRIFQI